MGAPILPGETDALTWLIVLIITMGVPWLSVKLYYWLETKPFPFLESWSSLAKYVVSVVWAVLLITIVWWFGTLVGLYDKPPASATWQIWVSNWMNIVLPVAVLQQVWYNFDKSRKARQLNAGE